MKPKILFLEDDKQLSKSVVGLLEGLGYLVVSTSNSNETEERLYEKKFDLLLLDINISDTNTTNLLRNIKNNEADTPVIFITFLSSVEDLEKVYRCECDDFICKPFVHKELQIRIEKILKRGFYHNKKEIVQIGTHLKYDTNANILYNDNQSLSLGIKELKLLRLFIKSPNILLPHERIYAQLWDYDEEPSDSALRTYIKNLRKIIGKEKIISIKKQGYKFIMNKNIYQ